MGYCAHARDVIETAVIEMADLLEQAIGAKDYQATSDRAQRLEAMADLFETIKVTAQLALD